MKRLIIVTMIVLLSGIIAMPALAKPGNKQNNEKHQKAYAKASKAEKEQMRADKLAKAKKARKKSEDMRAQVDAKMQQRLMNIKADSPGNIGPIGGN